MSIKGDIIKEYFVKFPKTSAATLSKVIYKDNKGAFKNVEATRKRILYYQGKMGVKNRQGMADNPYIKDSTVIHNPYEKLPAEMRYYTDWSPFEIVSEKFLLLADLHAPYYHKESLILALKMGAREKVDTILILGDLMDFYSVSFWEKDPRKRDIQNELNITRQILNVMQTVMPNAKIIVKKGNHDERLERYIKVKAPELLALEVLDFEHLLTYEGKKTDTATYKDNLTVIGDNRIMKFGKLNLVHGHEFGRAISSPVNPARGLYLRGKETAICAHHHRTSEHAETSMSSTVCGTWSVGALCDLHPEYLPMNKWNHGFAIIEKSTKGNFRVYNKKIIKGEVY